MTMLPLHECLRLPGITDGRLFRKNVRQSLGSNNKVNRAMRATILGDRVKDFFYYHNGVTALCDSSEVSSDKKMLTVKGLSVVNGCQIDLDDLRRIGTCPGRRSKKDAAILSSVSTKSPIVRSETGLASTRTHKVRSSLAICGRMTK